MEELYWLCLLLYWGGICGCADCSIASSSSGCIQRNGILAFMFAIPPLNFLFPTPFKAVEEEEEEEEEEEVDNAPRNIPRISVGKEMNSKLGIAISSIVNKESPSV